MPTARPAVRSSPRRLAALAGCLLALGLAACGTTESGIGLRGQSAKQLEEDRAGCLPFVQANTAAGADLAEAACLAARGYEVPLVLSQGPARIGFLNVAGRGDANSMVADFQACQMEGLRTAPPVIKDTDTSGIFSNFFSKIFPRGMWSHPPTPDDWALKSFAACLSRKSYAVSKVTRYQ
jgi:hypothetical protein